MTCPSDQLETYVRLLFLNYWSEFKSTVPFPLVIRLGDLGLSLMQLNPELFNK